jgi:hypothetical protein
MVWEDHAWEDHGLAPGAMQSLEAVEGESQELKALTLRCPRLSFLGNLAHILKVRWSPCKDQIT